jgi:NADP-dependent 3-hydroxy acid dehydrogenase YdfG
MANMNNSLLDRIVIVTGASSGIGAATAQLIAAEGATVVVVARRAERLVQLVEQIGKAGGRASAIAADVAREDECRRVVQETRKRHGRIDILVNSAGIVRPGSVEEADPASWREQIDINLLSPMYLSHEVLPEMRQRGDGHIVNVSSTAGRRVGVRHSGYAASKHAVNAYSEAMRQENAPFGIRVTIIEPGATETEVDMSIPNAQDRAVMHAHVNKEGIVKASEVGAAIVYALQQPRHVNIREIWIAPTYAVV